MGKVRDARIDTLKGILILAVVYGHFFTHDASRSVVSMLLANFIYSFHMPLFVFVSGFFSNNRHVMRGAMRLLETYIVYQLIKGIAYHYSPLWLLIMPAPMLWYLVALIIWRLLYASFEKMGVKISWQLLFLLVCVSIVAGFVPWIGREFALSRILVFAPYFFLGVIVQKKQIMTLINEKVNYNFAIGILALTLVFSSIFAMGLINVRDVFSGTFPYHEDNKLIYAGARLLSYLSSAVVSIAVIRVFSFKNQILGVVGKDSLKYYMFHGLCLMGVEFFALPWSIFYAVFYASVVSIAIFFFNKSKFSDFAIAPVSYIFNRKREQ